LLRKSGNQEWHGENLAIALPCVAGHYYKREMRGVNKGAISYLAKNRIS